MASAELIKLKERLVAYESAEIKVLKGAQSYTIENETIERPNLKTIQTVIEKLKSDIANIERGGIRVRRFVANDF